MSYFFHWLTTQIFWHGGNLGFKRLQKTDPITFNLKLHWPFNLDDNRLTTPLLLACSPTVIPRPDDWSSQHIHVPGYFFLDTSNSYQPPTKLEEFLSTDGPPVCVTFGSTVHRNGNNIYRTVLDALERTGNRAVILSGWSDMQKFDLAKNILVMESVPHDWLLLRCKTVIHHGGAGTTAAGLHSGIPNLVVSFAADQPFWGARVHAIGASTLPIPVKKLTTEKLVAALAEADGDTLRNSAQAAGRKIRAENGVGVAVQVVEEYVENWHESPPPEIFKV